MSFAFSLAQALVVVVFELFLYVLQGDDNARAFKAYELMWNSGYQRAVTSSTFNKLIQSASQTESLESALQVGDSSKQLTLKDQDQEMMSDLSEYVRVHHM